MSPLTSQQSILLVDDNSHDYDATKRSFAPIGVTNPIMYCADGDEALALFMGVVPAIHRGEFVQALFYWISIC
jgi:hypothetical protein